MAARKSSTSKVSNGGRQKNNVAKEAKRQAKFAAKREAGTQYEYKPISAKQGSKEWYKEKAERAAKNVDRRLPYAKTTSIFAKLDNELAKAREKAKNRTK